LVKRSSVPRLVVVDDPRSAGAEAYRLLRIDLQHVSSDPLRRVLVTSARPGEGKSTNVANLGAAFAQAERSVLIIDADMRRPTLHTVFRQPSAPGLSTYLAGNAMLAAVLHKTAVPNLTLLASGPIPPNPADLLASRRMRDLLEEATERFDVVLLDSPPILAVSDACAMAALVDGVLLVVGSGDTPQVALRRARAQVEAVHGRLLGAVVNRFNAKANGYSSHEYDSYDSYYGMPEAPTKGSDAKKGHAK
jgi:capsular exopolysaccharide synthesis family protein